MRYNMSKFNLNAYKEQNPSQVAVVELAVIQQKDHNGHRLPDAHIVAEDVVDHQGNIIAKKGQMVQHINTATNYETDGQEMLVNAYDEYNAKMLPGEVNDYFLNHGGFRNIKLNQDPEQIHPQMIPDKDLTGTLEFSNAQYDLTIKRSNQYRIIALEDIRSQNDYGGDGPILAKKGDMGAEIFCKDEIAAGITVQDLSEDLYMHHSWINPQSSIEVDNALPTLINSTVKTTNIKHPAEISNVTLINSEILNSKVLDVDSLNEPLVIENSNLSNCEIELENINEPTIVKSEIAKSSISVKNQSPEKDSTLNIDFANIKDSNIHTKNDGVNINIDHPTALVNVTLNSSNANIKNTYLRNTVLKDTVDLDAVNIDGSDENKPAIIENSKLSHIDIYTNKTNLIFTNTELDNEPNLFEENDFNTIIYDTIHDHQLENHDYTIKIDSGQMTHGYDKELSINTPTVQKEQTKEVSGPDF